MIQVNGLIVDARHLPRDIQEEAYRKGLIRAGVGIPLPHSLSAAR